MKPTRNPSTWFEAALVHASTTGATAALKTLTRWCNYIAFLALAFLSLQAQAQANNASYVSQSVPTSMTTGQSYTVSVTMLNTGSTTWTAASLYRLGSQNPQDNGTWGLGRVEIASSTWVVPGAQYTFSFTVRAPSTPGTYNFQWRMVRDGYEWFGAFTSNLEVVVSPPPPVNNAAFVSQSVPTSMTTGQSYTVSVTMHNTGNTTWTAANMYRLGSQNPQDGQPFGLGRVDLGASVAPGQQYTFTFTARAPSTPGTYNFQWRMVREGYEWFGALSPNIPVVVSAPPFDGAAFVSQSVPTSMAAGKPYTVSVTMQNTGNTTWTSGAAYKLGSQNPADNTTWRSSSRVDLTSAVAPGQQYTFNFQVTAPSTAGTYNFQWKMVREFSGWFGAASTNVVVTVYPPPTLGVTRGPSPMVAGQTYTLSWSTTGATSLSYACTSTGTGYTGSASVAVNGSSSGTASAAWVGYPSTCTWTATGPGGTTTATETMNTVAAPTNNAQFTAQSIPTSMTAGQSYPVTVTMTNNGTTTWTAANAFKLGAQNPADNTTWGLTRVTVPSSVSPGQQVTFSFNVTVPTAAGTYNQQWQMLQEGVGSFGQASTNVAVTVVPAAPVISPPPKTQTRTVAYEYDPTTGLLSKEIIEPSNTQLRLETATAYDGWGNLTSVTISSPATGTAAITTRVSTTSFDARGQFATGSVNALNQAESVTFDPTTGAQTRVTGPNGLTTQWQYDSFGRKTLEIRADGNRTRWDYAYCGGGVSCPAPAQYVITETPYEANGATPNGPWVKRYFDMLDREVESQTLGFDGTSVVITSTVYDDLGRVAYVSRPYFSTQSPVWNTFTYDALDRLASARDGAGKGSTLSYSGTQTVVRNALNQPRTIAKDALGRVSTITDAADGVLRYDYDAFGNVYKTTDPAGNTVLMAYDLRGNTLQMTDPDMGSILYAYDALGQVVRQTDAKNQVTTVTYDKLGRITNRAEADLVSTWSYDSCTKGVGKLCSTSADNGYARSFGYDAYGRLSTTVTTIDTSYSESTSFDANGRPATRTYPNGFAVKFGYTALGDLKDIRNNATNALYWQADARDADGTLARQTFGNNVTTQQVMHPLTGRIANIYAGPGDSVQSLGYTFDDAGNLLSRGDANQGLSESFLYDALLRLKSSTVSLSGAGGGDPDVWVRQHRQPDEPVGPGRLHVRFAQQPTARDHPDRAERWRQAYVHL